MQGTRFEYGFTGKKLSVSPVESKQEQIYK